MGDANTAVHPQVRQPSPQSDLSTLSNVTAITGPGAVSSIDASLAPSATSDTSQADTSSVHSDAPKANEQTPIQRRQSSRTRAVVATYNDKELAGTRLHTPRKYLKGLAASSRSQPTADPQPPPTTGAAVESHNGGVQVDSDPVENNAAENGALEIEAVEVTVLNGEQEELSEPALPSEQPEQSGMRRASSRRRSAVVTYNDKENAGTRIHTPTKYIDGTYIRKSLGDEPSSQSPLAGAPRRPSTSIRPQSSLRKSITADQLEQDAVDVRFKRSLAYGQRNLKRVTDRVSKTARANSSSPSKRRRKEGQGKAHDAGRCSDDTLRSRGHPYLFPKSPAKRAQKTKRTVKRQRIVELSPETDPEPARITEIKSGPLRKPWLSAGKFYNTGQDDLVGRLSAVIGHKPKKAADAEHQQGQSPCFPMPMFSMAEKLDLYPKKMLQEHKRPFEPFQLPFEVFSPLPKEVKVKDWRDLKRNEYKGEDAQETRARAKEQSKKARQMEASKCACTDKCDRDNCFNAVLFFECDDNSCNVGRHCGNRQFSDLRKRQQDDRRGIYYNKYNIGVEVMETPNRGHGVRAMRTFDRDQIVIEYIGEIITQQESDRRMRDVYKNHKCFYLMNFYDKLIIDGFRGNIARFVNHSCNPNCRMEKWTVNGEVRMALFADRYIMTGEELTWHYNFESYGKEQPCYCGSVNCAGVIGRQIRNKSVKEIREQPSGNKRKSARSPVKPKKKPKLNTIAAAASSTVKNIYSKTKSSVGGLLRTAEDTATSLKKAQEKDNRAERAARRSLVTQEAGEEEDEEDEDEDEEDNDEEGEGEVAGEVAGEGAGEGEEEGEEVEVEEEEEEEEEEEGEEEGEEEEEEEEEKEEEDEESEDDMPTIRTRSTRKTPTTSPLKESPVKKTITKRTTRVTELKTPSSRRSSYRVSRVQKTQESVKMLSQEMPKPLDASSSSELSELDSESSVEDSAESPGKDFSDSPAEDDFDSLAEPAIPKDLPAPMPSSSSLSKSSSFNSTGPLLEKSTLRQTTLALFSAPLRWSMGMPLTEPVKEKVRVQKKYEEALSASSGKKAIKRK